MGIASVHLVCLQALPQFRFFQLHYLPLQGVHLYEARAVVSAYLKWACNCSMQLNSSLMIQNVCGLRLICFDANFPQDGTAKSLMAQELVRA